MSGEIPSAISDNQSVRTTSGPLGPSEKHLHSPYIDPKQPGSQVTWVCSLRNPQTSFCITCLDFTYYRLILSSNFTVPVRIVDPSKDLNSYGLGNVDWKERVEGWKLKQEKNMTHMTSRYTEGKGDMEGTGSNGEELQMWAFCIKTLFTLHFWRLWVMTALFIVIISLVNGFDYCW